MATGFKGLLQLCGVTLSAQSVSVTLPEAIARYQYTVPDRGETYVVPQSRSTHTV